MLFSLFGFPEYVHRDRGPSFVAKETIMFLTSTGIATNRSTPCHPQGNAHDERTIQTAWHMIRHGPRKDFFQGD